MPAWYAAFMHPLLRLIKAWLPFAFIVTAFCGLVYGTVQQSYRQSANDPQIQMAEDAAAALGGNGSSTQSLPLSGTVDIGQSLSPYMVFYNDAGAPTGGNGLLDGQFPRLPAGIFDYVRAAGETRVTWQPEADIRQAIVVTRVDGAQPGFVMAGRSLREVEIREDKLGLMVCAAWFVTMLGTLALVAAGFWIVRPLEN